MMIPTLFSVSYAGLWGQEALGVEAFIARAAALGYGAVELMGKRPHLSVLDLTDGDLGRIRACAESEGVEIASVAGYTDYTGGARAGEVPFGEMQVLYVRELARVARGLGAKIVRVFTGYSTDEAGCAEDWRKCVAGLRESAQVAAEFGVILGVQNHHDTGISTDAYIELLDEVDHPNCKAMFDPWAPALFGEDLRRCAKRLAPRMVQTTLADYVRLPRWAYLPGLVNYRKLPDMVRAVPLGEGFVDLDGFFRGLEKGGFRGYVAYEMCSPLRGGGSAANLDRAAKISLERIRALIRAAGGSSKDSAKKKRRKGRGR